MQQTSGCCTIMACCSTRSSCSSSLHVLSWGPPSVLPLRSASYIRVCEGALSSARTHARTRFRARARIAYMQHRPDGALPMTACVSDIVA